VDRVSWKKNDMITLEIADSIAPAPDADILHRAGLVRAAQAAFEFTTTSLNTGMTILVSDDEQLRQLNHQFLGFDEPTDVLSFPAGHVDPDTNSLYLGDVILSYPRAAQQAAAAGHSLEDELRLLTVHGVLHLLGYDHVEQEDEAEMWQKQEEILRHIREM
jgi:probable rRNA maturation factor